MLVLVGGHAPTEQLARNFVNTRDRIETFLATTPAPFIAKIYRPSPIAMIQEGKPGQIILKVDWIDWRGLRLR